MFLGANFSFFAGNPAFEQCPFTCPHGWMVELVGGVFEGKAKGSLSSDDMPDPGVATKKGQGCIQDCKKNSTDDGISAPQTYLQLVFCCGSAAGITTVATGEPSW